MASLRASVIYEKNRERGEQENSSTTGLRLRYLRRHAFNLALSFITTVNTFVFPLPDGVSQRHEIAPQMLCSETVPERGRNGGLRISRIVQI